MPATNFIQICEIAKRIPCDRKTLRLALQRKVHRPHLVAKYYEMAAPAISAQASIAGTSLEPGTQLYLPSNAQAERVAGKIGAACRRSGRMITLCARCSIVKGPSEPQELDSETPLQST